MARVVIATEHLPGRTVRTTEGRELLYFSGTSYLGMSTHPRFLELIAEGLQRYGSNFGGSRRSNLQLPIFEEMEQLLANWMLAEAALVLASGTQAAQLAARVARQSASKVFVEPGTHIALSDNWTSEIPFPKQDRTSEIPFPNHKRTSEIPFSNHDTPPENTLLLRNSVDPLHCRPTPLPKGYLAHFDRIHLLVDDSHGMGVTGRYGEGFLGFWRGYPGISTTGSLGKALAVPAGFIVGSRDFIDACRADPLFGGSSPPPPAYAYAFVRARREGLYGEQLGKLRENVAFFWVNAPDLEQYRTLPYLPIFATDDTSLANRLLERDVLISSFRYPTPDDPVITRMVLSAAHTRADVARLCYILNTYI